MRFVSKKGKKRQINSPTTKTEKGTLKPKPCYVIEYVLKRSLEVDESLQTGTCFTFLNYE